MKALKFSWTYGSYQVDVYDTLESAMMAAVYGEDSGDESFDHVEYNGKSYDRRSAAWEAADQDVRTYYREQDATIPRATHRVEVYDGKAWAYYSGMVMDDPKDAEEVAALKEVVGDERVRMRKIKRADRI